MGWLIGHMWLLLALAALLGLLIGYWVWGGRRPNDTENLDIEVARLRSRCEVSDAAKNNLRAKVAELESEVAALSKAIPPLVPTFYDAPINGDPDDLKLIKGIGPKLEQLCHGLGVYYYRQISQWTDDQVVEVDAKLTFKGRIDRDDWRGQARDLVDDN